MRVGVSTRVPWVAGATCVRARPTAKRACASRPVGAIRGGQGGGGTRVVEELHVGRVVLERSTRALVALGVASCLISSVSVPHALAQSSRDEFYIEDIPQGLSSGDVGGPGKSLSSMVKGVNKKEIEKCTGKCIVTCTRGGGGAPGLGPLSVRKAPVVFKEGFRSRQYCLNECTEICSITVNASPSRR